SDLDVLRARRGLRHRKPLFAHLLQMELDGLTNEFQHLLSRLRGRDTPREVGNIGPKAAWPLLDNNGVAHRSSLQSGLLQNIIQGAFGNVNTAMTGDGDDAGFGGMFEVPVAAARPGEIPTIGFHHLYRLPDF